MKKSTRLIKISNWAFDIIDMTGYKVYKQKKNVQLVKAYVIGDGKQVQYMNSGVPIGVIRKSNELIDLRNSGELVIA